MVTVSWLSLGVWTCIFASLRTATPTTLLSTDNDFPAITEFSTALRKHVNDKTGSGFTGDDSDYEDEVCILCYHEGLVYCCELPTDPPTTTSTTTDNPLDDDDEEDHEEEGEEGDEESHRAVQRTVGLLILLAFLLSFDCLLFYLPGDHLAYDKSWHQEDYKPQEVITYGKVDWVLCWRTDGPCWRDGKWVDLDYHFTWVTSQGSTTVGGSKQAQELQKKRLADFQSQEPLSSFSSSRRSSANGGGGGILVDVDVHEAGDAHENPSVDNNNNQPDCSSTSHPVKPNLTAEDTGHGVPQQDLDITGNTDSTVYHGISFSPLHPSLFTAGQQTTIPLLSPDQSSSPTPLPDLTGKSHFLKPNDEFRHARVHLLERA